MWKTARRRKKEWDKKRDWDQDGQVLGHLKSRKAVDASADLDGLEFFWEAVLEFAIFNDGILTSELFEFLLALHLDFERSLATRDRNTIKV